MTLSPDDIEDLKDMLTNAVIHGTADLRQSVKELQAGGNRKMRGEITDMRGEITDMRGDITDMRGSLVNLTERVEVLEDKVDTILEVAGDQFQDHERRLVKLEARAVAP